MGLLLSVFVVFVSVVELLTVYSDFQRRLQPVNSDRDFSPLIRRYEAGLHKERQRILKILDEYRKLEKIAECHAEGEPSTSQPDAHQLTTESKEASRSPSPAIPAVPRNSFCIEAQNDVCKDDFPFEENTSRKETYPTDDKKGDNLENFNIQSRSIFKDNLEKIANALNELVPPLSAKEPLEENGIINEIAPNISTVSIQEDALQIASKSGVITRMKKENIELKKLGFEKKILKFQYPAKTISQYGNLDIIDDAEKNEILKKHNVLEINNEIDKQQVLKNDQAEIILEEESLNITPEQNNMKIINEVEKIEIVQTQALKNDEKREDEMAKHSSEISDTKVSDIIQQQIPLNDEEIFIKEDSLNNISEQNNLRFISNVEKIDFVQQISDNYGEKFISEEIISDHIRDNETNGSIQQTKNETGVISRKTEIINYIENSIVHNDRVLLNEESSQSDNIQQQVLKNENEIIPKEVIVNTNLESNKFAIIKGSEKSENVTEIIDTAKQNVVQKQISENSEKQIISNQSPFNIGNAETNEIVQQDSLQNLPEIIHNTEKSDNNQQKVSKSQEEEVDISTTVQQLQVSYNEKEFASKEGCLEVINEQMNITANGGNFQQQVCKVETKQEDPLNIISQHTNFEITSETEVKDTIQQVSDEKEIISEQNHNIEQEMSNDEKEDLRKKELITNIVCSDNDVVILKTDPSQTISEHMAKINQSDDAQQQMQQVFEKEGSLQIISEQRNDTEKNDNIQQETSNNEKENLRKKEVISDIVNSDNDVVISKEDLSQIVSEHMPKIDQSDDVQQQIQQVPEKEVSLQIIFEQINNTEKNGNIQQKMSNNEKENLRKTEVISEIVNSDNDVVISKEDSLQVAPQHIAKTYKEDDVQQLKQRVPEKESFLQIISEQLNETENNHIIQQETFNNEKNLLRKEEIISDIVNSDVSHEEIHKDDVVISKEDSLQIVKSEDAQQQMPKNKNKDYSSNITIDDIGKGDVVQQHVSEYIGDSEKNDIIQEQLLKTEKDVVPKQNHSEIKSDVIQLQMAENGEEGVISKKDSLNIIPERNAHEIEIDNDEENSISESSLQTVIECINETDRNDNIQQQLSKNDNVFIEVIPEPVNDTQQQVLENVKEIISLKTENGDVSDKELTSKEENATKTQESFEITNPDNISEELSKSNDENTLEGVSVTNIKKCPQEIAHLEEIKLHSITFDNVDYWPNKVLIEKKKIKSKNKSKKKHVKFGLHVEELEPEWSRAPSPIFKLINSSSPPAEQPRTVNFQSLQITDLNQQLVKEDVLRGSSSPFRDFLESNATPGETTLRDISEQIALENEDDKKSSLHLLRKLEEADEFVSWDPNRKILSTDEEVDAEVEVPLAIDEEFINALDGLKSSKLEKKKKSRRKQERKSSKQNSLESDSRMNNSGISESSFSETEVAETSVNKISSGGSKSIRKVEKRKIAKRSDEDRSEKEDNSASNAFWLIFSGEYTKAMNKDWHGQHFCCWQCDESLTGQRYVLREEHPYCVACYESVFANSCEKCSRTIGIDSKDLSYKDKHWHEACFLCATCGDSLVDKQFGSKGDRIYCGRCYDEQFASRCDGCGEIFRAGTKKMEYKTRQWHEKCFCCCVCKTPIGTQSFIPREQEIYCAKCYEEKYATRCIKCNKVITSGGVTYKNEPWHRECFTCTHCNTSLAGARFTSRDDKPYCAECFGELFAKRCTACNKPITGIGGTKFISFEDRHWHNDCFFCASCRTSLVGRGFITDGDDIICPECAKQKLM